MLLVNSAQTVVSKDEIAKALWPNQDVSEQALSQAVHRLRSTLAIYDPHTSYIVAVPARGYKFTQQIQSEQLKPEITGIAFRHYRQALSSRTTITPEAIGESARMLELALEEEPYYVDALVAASETYVIAAQLVFMDPFFALRRAKRHIKRALEIEPCSSETHSVLSTILLLSEHDPQGALQAANNALAFDPKSERALGATVWALIANEKFPDAVLQAKQLLHADPASPNYNALLGIALYYSKAFDEAVPPFYDALDLDAKNGYALNYLLRSLCALEQYDDAHELLKKIETEVFAPCLSALAAYVAGRKRRSLVRGRNGAPGPVSTDNCLLEALVSIGRKDWGRGREHLQAAIQKLEPGLALVPMDPLFAALKSIPEMQEVGRTLSRPTKLESKQNAASATERWEVF